MKRHASPGSVSVPARRPVRPLPQPHVTKQLHEVFQTDEHIYMIIELCHGGELLDRLNSEGTFSDQEAKLRIKEMVDVVRYLHSYNIAHCDLKLENWLFATADPASHLRLIDFGFAKHFKQGEKLPSGAVG